MLRGVRRAFVCALVFGLLTLAVGWGGRAHALDLSDSAHLAERTRLLLRLAEAVHWPISAQDSSFRIEVLDTTAPQHEPLLRARGRKRKKIHGKPLAVTQTRSWAERDRQARPHIFYVSAAFTKWLPQIHTHFSGSPVLVVSETPYSGTGWMAYFERVSRDQARVARRGHPEGILVWSLNLTNMFSIAQLTTYSQEAQPNWVTRRRMGAEEKPERLSYAAALDSLPRLVDLIARQRDTVAALRYQLVGLRWRVDSMRLARLLPHSVVSLSEPQQVRMPAPLGALPQRLHAAPPEPARDYTSILYAVGIGVLILGGGLAMGLSAQGSAMAYALRTHSATALRVASALLLAVLPQRRAAQRVQVGAKAPIPPRPQRPGATASAHTLTRKRYLEEMSHGVRTPLNAIVGLSQYIAEPSASEEEKSESVGLIRRNIFELTTRLNSMVLLARLEAQGVQEQPGAIALDAFLAHVEELESQHVAAVGRADTLRLCRREPRGEAAPTLWGDAENLAVTIDMLVAMHVRNASCHTIEYGYQPDGHAGIRLFVRGISGGQHHEQHFTTRRPVDPAYINELSEGSTELSVAVGLQALRNAHVEVAIAPSVGVEYSLRFEV